MTGWLTTASGGGVRSSSMNYLGTKVYTRENLDILYNTRVIKLNFKSGSNPPIVTGVMVQNLRDGPVTDFEAKKEVILSAGAIATPQLLLLSGIGPADELAAKGIPVTLDSPHVGRNLQDHPWTIK